MKRLILASASPRRRALLAALGIEFETLPSAAAECDEGSIPAAIVEANARAKRDEIAARIVGAAIVIGADTLVFLDEHVLSKPRDRGEAIEMLQRLSGCTHQVLTGVALRDTETGQTVEGFESTDVTFRRLSTPELERFVDIVNPLDRAGAYTVDGPGSLLVARYDGCYQNVLGLPIIKLDKLLRELGVSLFDRMHAEKAKFL